VRNLADGRVELVMEGLDGEMNRLPRRAMLGTPGDTFKDARVLPPDIVVRRDPDGTIRAHSPYPLGPYPERLTEKLDLWAATAPGRSFLAARDSDGAWKHLTYLEARTRVRCIAQALFSGVSRRSHLLVLSGNSIEHALMALAAIYIGVPCARRRLPIPCW
jgi:feruloyl-CoA synthase